ncbi:Glu-tRNA(Gln) amidotransferase subunit GatD [Candidatus Woesearchaeota archaeon]|nr:Glu-tRNA(Gln) amidotransferase subunit GatD [Candidatus Woesearchaeota archaeon]
MKLSTGDLIEFLYNNSEIRGILIEEKEEILVVKLDSGYNIGVNKKNISKIKILKSKEIKKENKKEISLNKDLPLISILHTGGTISSKVDYETGGVSSSFKIEDLISLFPELKDIANLKTREVFNISSEDIRFFHYKLLAEAINEEIKAGVKGIIIGHGTDTLALTASALSFVFENLPIPVLLVGSQRSSDRGSSDASMNLICAAEFISKTDFAGVAICMHESTSDDNCIILSSCKTKKLHTSKRDAFKPVNDSLIARINYKTKDIQYLKEYKKSNQKLIIKDKFEEKVAILKVYPNMFPDVIENFTKNNYKGLVIEGSGLGHMPITIKENLPIFESLKNLIKSGCLVIMTSNCINGRVNGDVYSVGRKLKEIGVIFGEDMLPETAFIKLAWLLGNYKKDEVKSLIIKNLRGEISERTLAY